MIQTGTIGKSPAAILLNEILIKHQDDYTTHWVLSTIVKFREGLVALESVPLNWRETFSVMLLDKYLKVIAERGLPDDVFRFLNNVIRTDYKIALRKAKGLPTKE